MKAVIHTVVHFFDRVSFVLIEHKEYLYTYNETFHLIYEVVFFSIN